MTDMTGYEMTCDAFADRLADYLEGDLSGPEREAMEAHAGRCESCDALRGDLLLIARDAAALPTLQPSRDLWSGIAERIDTSVLPMDGARQARAVPSIRRGWVRPAIAAAALVIFTAGVTHVLTRVSLAPTSSVAVAPSTPAPVSRPNIAIDSLPAAVRQVASVSRGDAGTTDDAAPARTGASTRNVASDRSARTGSRPASDAVQRASGGTTRLARAEPLLHEAEPVYDREITKLRSIVRERRSQLDPRTIAVLEQSVAVIDSAIAQSRAALARDPASGFLATQLNHSLEKKVELLRTAALLPART